MTEGMVSAACINWEKREILLVFNTDLEKPLGFWGLPGGKMKEEETAEAGAVRELYQETSQEGKTTKYSVEIPKTGSKGDYIHFFIAIRIPEEKELKNHEDPAAIPKWIPFQEIITGRVKMFRGHVQGLILVLEKMVEQKSSNQGKVDRNGIPIISEGPSALLETLNELKNAFSTNGQFVPSYRRR